jgi:hypothetical protein
VPCSGGLDLPCDLYVPETFSFPYFVECKNEAKFCINSILLQNGIIHQYYGEAEYKKIYARHFWKKYIRTPDTVVVFKGGCFSTAMVMFQPHEIMDTILYHVKTRFAFDTLENWLVYCPKLPIPECGTSDCGTALEIVSEDDGEVN